MILGDAQGRLGATGIGGRATLDDLFHRAAARRPDAIALIDPPNRAAITHGEPRSLTYAQADRMVAAIAGRLWRIGLRTDAIVGMQLANTVECVLTLLGVLRAGMIAMPLPLLWRRADATMALNRAGASALIVNGRIGAHDQFDVALQVASEIFPIRYVCGFGQNVPDGVVPLDELFAAETIDSLPPLGPDHSRLPGPAAHLAVITCDVAAGGIIPVARSHTELIAGGLAVLFESRFRRHATILSTMPMASLAGLATTLVPWLLVGGTLALRHPFERSAFLTQQHETEPDVAILPGLLVAEFAEAGDLSSALKNIVGVWRAPERLSRAAVWRDGEATALTDVQVFGEIGLIAARRNPGGRPSAIAFGALAAPRGSKGSVIVSEVRPTAGGTVAMRGSMVPRFPFPPGIERTALPQFRVSPGGFVDTGCGCWSDREDGPMVVTGPPPGMVGVGGYRFVMRDLQDDISKIDSAATLTAVPDALAGHRLAGTAPDPSGVQEALEAKGVNPLLVHAFRERRAAGAGDKTPDA